MPTLIEEQLFQEIAPSPDAWYYHKIDNFAKGIDLAKNSRDLELESVLVGKGVRKDHNRLVVDFGFKKFGQVVIGAPRATYQLFLKNGSSFLTLITDLTFYVWAVTPLEWQYVSNGTSTTLSANEASGQTVLSVVSETGFAAGERVGITLDDGTQHQTTVASTGAGIITVDDALPSAAASGNTVVEALLLIGSTDIGVSITTVATNDWMVFANGNDTPQRFDGSTVEDVPNLPGTTFICKIAVMFDEYLLLMNTTEDGVARPQRVRNSDTGDPTNWTTGNAGFLDLVASEDFITAAANLPPYMIIYKERSVIRMELVGEVDLLFNFVDTVTGEGTLSQDNVIDLGTEHLVIGNSNIYFYRGGFDLEPIGDKIRDELFAQTASLNKAKQTETFAIFIEELDEVWFFYLTGVDTSAKDMVRIFLSDQAFLTRKYSVGFKGFGFFAFAGGLTWNDAVGTWAQQAGTWLSDAVTTGAPTTHLCSDDPTNQVYEYDYVQVDDDGAIIPYEVQTKDFFVPNRELRFDRFDAVVRGSNVTLSYSLDEGITWISLGTTLGGGSAFKRSRIFKQTVGNQIRFRFTGSGDAFGVESMAFRYKFETLYEEG